jgi:nitrate/TMAO reductase-like tetraheme cytochrome c subunit
MRQALQAEPVDGLDYEDSATCGRCHVAQRASWRQSQHAQAWTTLVRRGRTGDPNCLACHTSGFGTRRGFYTPDTTPHLAGVNCQDCHRFNLADHARAEFVEPEPTAQTCRTCHTPVTDPDFNWQARRDKIRCPAAGPMFTHDAPSRPGG